MRLEPAVVGLEGKVALISGASKGIGAAMALAYAAAGAKVVVNFSSSENAANSVVRKIAQNGGEALSVHGDFSKEIDIDRCFAAIKEHFGQLDVLVNNAGVFKFNALADLDSAEFHRHFNLNVLGTLLACKRAVELMPKDGGSILNITSIVSSMAPARSTVYAASKGAIESATTALSKELGPRNIRVNSLAPVVFREFRERTPLGRIGMTQDIASIAVFLASPAAYWLNGQHIVAAGGMTM